MVHVSNTVLVLAALAVVPAFAAPVALELEARGAQDLNVRSGQHQSINKNVKQSQSSDVISNTNQNINTNASKKSKIIFGIDNKSINKNTIKKLKRRSSESLAAFVRANLMDQFDIEARGGQENKAKENVVINIKKDEGKSIGGKGGNIKTEGHIKIENIVKTETKSRNRTQRRSISVPASLDSVIARSLMEDDVVALEARGGRRRRNRKQRPSQGVPVESQQGPENGSRDFFDTDDTYEAREINELD
ncbi:hypothetical protein BKA70DRAFT_1236447 [Coprinopsis sp. MPI-PUGE-AT-0042]|nr:hypothetical protein BKA70DRAFT_1236447 [Coprinopsis sp. MPI-PUGE-AT-0042]